MNGDRWVVRYPSGQWGVERSNRRMSSVLFSSVQDALQAARQESTSAGGGEVAVQASDGGLSLREQVSAEPGRGEYPRKPTVVPRDVVDWTVLA